MRYDLTNINKEYYNNAYSSKHLLFTVMKALVSFDQQSKSKRNYAVLKETIKKSNHTLKLLDYGFGRGALLLKIPRYVQVYGCELSHEAIRNMNELNRLFKKDIILFKPKDLPTILSATKLDIICCSHVIEHVEDDVELMRCFVRHLNNYGKLLINVPINEVWKDPKHFRTFSEENICNEIVNLGLRIEKVVQADRWTAFFLFYEKVNNRMIYKIPLKFMRMLFAIMPIGLLDLTEHVLPDKYKYQQVIILASKND